MKARLLAVLLVSTLVLATAAPLALAQVTVEGNDNVAAQYVDCSQVQAAFGSQYGDANAAAGIDGEATAEVAQKLNISQNQVNACLGEGGGNPGDGKPPATNPPTGTGKTPAPGEDGRKSVMASTIPEVTELPNTGGASLLSLGVGLALVAGGASLIRFRR